MMMRKRFAAMKGVAVMAVGICLPAAPVSAPVSAQDMNAIAHGKALVERNCGFCHQTGLEGDSPNPTAPPFWTMFMRRAPDTIAEMLLTQSSPKHSDMPRFKVSKEQAGDIAAWIAWVQPAAHGRRLSEENCARCHAIGLSDESSHEDAPPFRDLVDNFPLEVLEEAFAGSIESGHLDMPVFKVTDVQLQDILAYIAELSEKPKPE